MWPGLFEKRRQTYAGPLGIADQASATGVSGTFQSHRQVLPRLSKQVVVTDFERIVHGSRDGQLPVS